ncbi:MAG: molybdopterin dinucleotide binding domain-containing protein [Desulfotignum sp.]|nr:molybdopterin dinucleotide binding domain-containing protein [Desulfotignum sp.]
MKENLLWINTEKAAALGITDGATVVVASSCGNGRIKAFVTDMIHPEAVFMVHGFGHEAKLAKRSYNQGLSDALLQENLYDKVGGSPAFHDTFVTVTPV